MLSSSRASARRAGYLQRWPAREMADLRHIDFRFSSIDYELWALTHDNELVEGQWQFLEDQTRLRARAKLNAQGIPADDPE